MCMCMCMCMYLGCAGSDTHERVRADCAEAPREHSGASILERRRRGDGCVLAILKIVLLTTIIKATIINIIILVEAVLRLLAVRAHNHHAASTRPGCVEGAKA